MTSPEETRCPVIDRGDLDVGGVVEECNIHESLDTAICQFSLLFLGFHKLKPACQNASDFRSHALMTTILWNLIACHRIRWPTWLPYFRISVIQNTKMS